MVQDNLITCLTAPCTQPQVGTENFITEKEDEKKPLPSLLKPVLIISTALVAYEFLT